MRKILFIVFAFVFVAFISSCDKGDGTKPDPKPKPPDPVPEVVIEIQLDFSGMPEGMHLNIVNAIALFDADLKGIKVIPYTLPISTLRLTGEEAHKYAGKKTYVCFQAGRNNGFVQPAMVFKRSFNPTEVLPKVNRFVIEILPVSAGDVYYYDPEP